MASPLQATTGWSYPLGATVYSEGVNFSLFSRHATAVELLLFDRFDDPEPSYAFRLDPEENRTFYYWHLFIPGLRTGQIYAYRVDGPYAPELGHRFDYGKVLLDPYAREVIYGANWDRDKAAERGDNCACAMKCVVLDLGDYDWEGDLPLRTSFNKTIIYELHVGGFTKHPSSGVSHPGTYYGLVEKIPYLQSLGITAVELLPVQQFDEQEINSAAKRNPSPDCTCNSNYWGYNPVNFFAPHRGYCASLDAGSPVTEFRDMVKSLHRAGIEVIVDVVFNHTAESDDLGPTFCYRGLENRAYYLLDPNDRSRYSDYTGTGNTINANHSIVRRLILDALHYWVQELHVDGFRFDLASVLSRDEWGQPMRSPPILWDIESDPFMVGTKIIAEAWDAAGLYQVGTFIGHRWAEWNGRYRDDVRRFIRGDDGTVTEFAARIIGSPDIYAAPDHALHRSINFVTAHDGFTMNDLVSYNSKHNLANGEGNQDGVEDNSSWNCGFEGPTEDPEIETLRVRQIKNALTILAISQGTPMFLFGDEIRRTQRGNNNAYCQDNETSWFNWDGPRRHAGLLRFFRNVVCLNRQHSTFNLRMYSANSGAPHFPGTLPQDHISWHGVKPNEPDWGYHSHSIALWLRSFQGDADFYVMFNAYWQDLTFQLPAHPNEGSWLRVVDTSRPSPDDIASAGQEELVTGTTYLVGSRSVVVLMSRASAQKPHK